MRVRHTGIVVQNMEQMLNFYAGKLGMKVIYDQEEKVRIAKLSDDEGGIIELLQFETMSPAILRQRGISHVAFTVDPEGNHIELVEVKNVAK